MSFFSDEEIHSLRITRMILHVVGTKNFEAQPERALEEEAFFIGKIVDMAAAPVFMFKAVSTTRNEIEAIATGPHLSLMALRAWLLALIGRTSEAVPMGYC